MKKDEIVYSYTLGEKPESFNNNASNGKNESKEDGFIRIRLEKNRRGGKTVTVIYGFKKGTDMNTICAELKKKCGSGGTVKNDHIEIQGDKKGIVEKHLISAGFKVKYSGG
jgi:translation initiation factor 1